MEHFFPEIDCDAEESTDRTDYRGIEKEESPSVKFQEVFSSRADDSIASIIVDTRTPKEFEEAHVWNAANFPLMSNDERHLVGTTYHHESKESAISQGWGFFSPKIGDYLQSFEEHREKRIFVYCWRGGMRSRIVVNLLRIHGFDAVQLKGGYKLYTNEIIHNGLDAFASSYSPKFIVLVGYTGSRKTEILKDLDAKGLPVIDLEGLAGHKGSIYGSVDTTPKSQKMFSILLYHKLQSLENSPYIFVEAESNKIGNVHLPLFVNEKIKEDMKVLVTASLPTRVAAIRKEYFATVDSVRQLHEASDSVTLLRIIGKQNVQMLHTMLDEGEYDAFTEFLLVNYYDLRYKHTKADYSYALEVSSDDLGDCCANLSEFHKSLVGT
mmetsp:Transcript_53514/g.160133  ORF Transcript_53514/g.160133 Transcript_53514/m.160133 type:complete len:381 (-) Transcript_53514:296-1438(-)